MPEAFTRRGGNARVARTYDRPHQARVRTSVMNHTVTSLTQPVTRPPPASGKPQTRPLALRPMSATTRREAAFFDLDKTVLARSAGLAFARPFYRGGLMRRSDVLRSAYAQFIFSVSSADARQTEALRRYLSRLVTGWDVTTVQQIINDTLDHVIDPIVHAEAVELMAQHRDAGRDIVIISASGTEVVAPIGARLGADITIGSTLEVRDGKYTGEIAHYTHGQGKAEVMRLLASERGYDLHASYAYSDSSTDIPMLEAVGHPAAVNPDSTLRRVAEDRAWPVLEFRRPITMPSRLPSIDKRTGTAVVATAVVVGAAWLAYHALRRRTRVLA